MHHISTIEGHLQAKGLRFALVASRFNDFIVDRLVGGAVDAILRHGGERENLRIVRVPGAFDMPVVAKQLAAKDDLDGIICLGAVIRGATPHFEYVAAEVSKGLAQARNLHAGQIVRELGKHIKGGGGGQPFFATAGGKDPSGIPKALEAVVEYLK